MLVLKNITKKFNDVTVLKNLNVEFNSGINFILGPSGSGKSTLLKLISGMDNEFEGEIFYNGDTLKSFNQNKLDSYYYNSVGFIWQNFQLLNHLSVEDNVKLVLELSDLSEIEKNNQVKTILNRLGILKLAKYNASKLSGGEKQRVAMARALVKNPDIIIADEPTGALDKKSSQVIMSVLKKISKEKLVIVVTHDKSLVDSESNCFLLKDGVILATSKQTTNINKLVRSKKVVKQPKLSCKNSFLYAIKNFKGLWLKFILTSLILMMSSYFLLLNFSGSVVNEQQEILNQLIVEKGETLRDIMVPTSVMSASGTGGGSNSANMDIEQDVSSLLDKYINDPRIEHFIVGQPVGDMVISIDGVTEDYKVENSNNYPNVEKLLYGEMPNPSKREVAVPKLLLDNLNLEAEAVIGKKISVKGSNPIWVGDEPTFVDVEVLDLTIAGVIDSTVKYENPNGGYNSFEPEDSFIYSMEVVKEFKEQVNASTTNLSFSMRVKNIEDIVPIVDELNKAGITPIGQFESVKDILTINNTTSEQSGSVSAIIAIVAIVVTLAVTLINGYLRKSEYAILKINGYSKNSLFKLNIAEYLLTSIVAVVIFVMMSPVINNISSKMFNMSANGLESIILGVVIILVQGIIMGVIASVIAGNTKVINNLNTGDR